MAYRVEVSPKADAQLGELDSTVGSAVERKIIWLGENAAVMVHHRLVGMPDDLAGLCKLRVGHWRILYWVSGPDSPLQRFNDSTIETRSLPALARSYPPRFTFYAAHPVRSIQLCRVSRRLNVKSEDRPQSCNPIAKKSACSESQRSPHKA